MEIPVLTFRFRKTTRVDQYNNGRKGLITEYAPFSNNAEEPQIDSRLVNAENLILPQ